MKKYVLTTLTVLWMGVIFWFSSKPALESSSMSNNVIDNTIIKICQIVKSDLNDKQIANIRKIVSRPVRKLGHFTVYFILGLLVVSMLKSYGIKNKIIIYASIVCFIYALSDEIHQFFVDGRSCEILDVVLDTFSSMFSIMLIEINNRKMACKN